MAMRLLLNRLDVDAVLEFRPACITHLHRPTLFASLAVTAVCTFSMHSAFLYLKQKAQLYRGLAPGARIPPTYSYMSTYQTMALPPDEMSLSQQRQHFHPPCPSVINMVPHEPIMQTPSIKSGHMSMQH